MKQRALLLLSAVATAGGFAVSSAPVRLVAVEIDAAAEGEPQGAAPRAPGRRGGPQIVGIGRRRRRASAVSAPPGPAGCGGDAALLPDHPCSVGARPVLVDTEPDLSGADGRADVAEPQSGAVRGAAAPAVLAAIDAGELQRDVGLLLSLEIKETSLQKLHWAIQGSFADFLNLLHRALCTTASVAYERIHILGLHGRWTRESHGGLRREGALPMRKQESVVVRFELAPKAGGARDEADIIERLRSGLLDPNNSLRAGKLQPTLGNASMTISLPSVLSHTMHQKPEGIVQLSTMALPIGISAAFTGILIWLAAW